MVDLHAEQVETMRRNDEQTGSETHQNTNRRLGNLHLSLLVAAAQSQLAFEVSPH